MMIKRARATTRKSVTGVYGDRRKGGTAQERGNFKTVRRHASLGSRDYVFRLLPEDVEAKLK